LIEVEDAGDEDGEADEIEHDDTPRQAREPVPEGEMLDDPAN
jgi:hypothetical protein